MKGLNNCLLCVVFSSLFYHCDGYVAGRNVFKQIVPRIYSLTDSQSVGDACLSATRNFSKRILPILLLVPTLYFPLSMSTSAADLFPTKGYQTKSGLKYFDLKESGEGVSPAYGQFVSFYYTMYYRPSPSAPLQLIDSTEVGNRKQPFLQKHGNGRIIRGIEEGLHTMKVGSKRRIIIPKTMGYIDFGLGPLPTDPFRRRSLGEKIDLLNNGQGELVVDLELVNIVDDENDQGYYDDIPVSQEEIRQLVLKSIQKTTPELIQKVKETTPRQ